jgi:cruciform cutting endonuclease 1
MTGTSGTKPILIQRIAQCIQIPLLRPLPKNTPHRILSIDMGIRNLALCLVHIPSTQIPEITDWNRVTVSQKPDSSVPESFEPIDYAAKAFTLMKYSLEKYNPHTILIERQRYRSDGGSAVQEWTVRVNMLESMFHAVLYTISQQESGYNFVVHSVSPKKVTQLWTAELEEKMNIRETKKAKIAAAEKIVRGNSVNVNFTGLAKDVAEGFNKKRSGTKKFDDLADSMLQGLGWWKWHVNRSLIMDEILSWENVVKTEKKTRKSGTATKTRTRQLKRPNTETPAGISGAIEDDVADGDPDMSLTQKTKLTLQRKK